MAALDIGDYDNYVAYCRTSGEEVEALYRNLLISVTRFFRDQNQFEQLRAEFQKRVEGKDLGQPRIWIAGCATGEEVYSLAIILSEAMGGLDKLKKSRVQIFAADTPDQFLEKYFNVNDGRVEVVSELRAVTLFSMHNIIHDPPFLNVDFVSIRNVMIYFNALLQSRVLHRIHYALNPDGMLFLGTSETVGSMESLFEMRAGGARYSLNDMSAAPPRLGLRWAAKALMDAKPRPM